MQRVTDPLDTTSGILGALVRQVEDLEETVKFAHEMAGDLPPPERDAFRRGLRIKEAARAVLPPDPPIESIRATLEQVYAMGGRR